ncbi:tetratricopeptide repeat protein [Alcaligenes endophyticus]|uniref:Tetratricopeptide repeat protein n=1 Tax=Alcaligenes endophyticus TaxID=1929088 RepID=A0ABT8EGT2_9BURK|nr:tetratricopeptide repeat protein [Alcaligenes endophyticus]MCX5589865.1 tetratricopeptide repeat protein [Alcaligenes endophyticus]MDN4120472.1 tetratricopeptide repeat protein [Alcaligenes endophyticus]
MNFFISPITLAGSLLLAAAAPAQGLSDGGAMATPEYTEHVELRAGQLPLVTLTPDVLYRVLLGEIAANRNDYEAASQIFLSLAVDTSDPRFAQYAFQYSMADRNLTRALRSAQQWALLAPQDPEAKATALALEASNGQTEGLAEALWIRIDKAQDKEQAIIQAMSIVSKMIDRHLALEVLDQALKPSVRNISVAHLVLADVAWNAEDEGRAYEESLLALDLEPDSELAIQRVLEYGMVVDAHSALDRVRAYLKNNPDSRNVQLLLASRLVERRQFDEALQLVHQLQKRAPEDFDLLYTEAEIQSRAGHYAEARQLLENYIQVQSQRRQTVSDQVSTALASISEARLSLVHIAEAENNLDEAIRQLDLIEESGLRFQAQVHKAVLQARKGDLAAARRTLELSRPDTRGDHVVVALTYASIYQQGGRTDQAVTVLERADSELPDSPEVLYQLGMLYERQGRTQDFERLMQQVIDLRPDDANAFNALGYTYADQNRRLDEAQDLLERAMEIEPHNPYILDSVGWYLYRVGDYQAALEYLQRSYEKLPEADVAAHLGEVLWAKGRKQDAINIFRAALNKDPDSEVLHETLRRLELSLP